MPKKKILKDIDKRVRFSAEHFRHPHIWTKLLENLELPSTTNEIVIFIKNVKVTHGLWI